MLDYKNILKVLLGTFIMGLGVSLIIHGTLGADTLSVFIFGLINLVDLPFGIWTMIVNVTILLVAVIFGREQLGLGSVINATFLGLSILALDNLVNKLIVLSFYDIVAMFIGPILFGFGSALYVSAKKGAAGLECITLILTEKFGISLKLVRIILDIIFVSIGMILGASIGIGTLVYVVLVGPVLEISLNKLSPSSRVTNL